MQAQWKYITATAIGTSHQKHDLPCQDYAVCDTAIDVNGHPVLLAAVSDGAGSAELSQIGSKLSCEVFMAEAVKYLTSNPITSIDRDIALTWLEKARQAISSKAQDDQKEPRDYACTFLAAMIGENHSAFIQIGDGAIVVSDGGDAEWSWVFWPQRGEFANVTFFLTGESFEENVEFSGGPSAVKELALFTDGLEGLVLEYATKSVFHRFFDNMFPSVRNSATHGLNESLSKSLEVFLASPSVCERTDDDKSLILATRKDLAVPTE